jgi:hypothetical protein
MISRLCLAFSLIMCFVSVSAAAENKEAKKQEKPQAIEVKQDEEMAKRIEEAGKEINNTKWQVTFNQITQAEKKDSFADTISFKDGKVEVASLTSQGFNASGFTISVKGKNTIVWETMQTGEGKGLAFWKGEIEDGKMRGVLSRHLDEKTVKDYSFYSTAKDVIQEEAPIAAAPAAVAEKVKKEETTNASDVKAVPSPAKEEKKKGR